MAAVVGGIQAYIEADPSRLDSALKVSATKIDAFGTTMSQRLARLDRQSSKSFTAMAGHQVAYRRALGLTGNAFTTLGGSLAGWIAGAVSLRAVFRGMNAAVEKFGKLADQAATAGLDVEYFQGIAISAREAGVAVDTTASALATFQKGLGELQAGRGRLATALADLSPELLQQLRTARDAEAAFRAVANALRDSKTDAQAAAISAAAFGTEGIKMVAAFRGGADAIDLQIQKLRDMNIIVSRDVIASADTVGDRFELWADVLDTRVKTALLGLAPVIDALAERAANLINILTDQMAGIKPLNIASWGPGGAGTQMNQHLSDLLRGMAYPDTSVPGLPRRLSEAQYGFDYAGFFNPATAAAVDAMRTQVASSAFPGVAPTTFDFRGWLDGIEPVASGFDKIKDSAEAASIGIEANANAVTQLSENWKTAESSAQTFASTFLSSIRAGKTWVESLTDAIISLADELSSMLLRQGVQGLFNALSGGLTGGLGSIATGAVIPVGGFVPGLTGPRLFANGGAFTNSIVAEPTPFRFSKGIGLMGEAGPEAILPLSRDRSGRLGVIANQNVPVPANSNSRGDTFSMHFEISGSRQDASAIARQTEAIVHKVITQRARNPYRR